jgi:hypothetical protein
MDYDYDDTRVFEKDAIQKTTDVTKTIREDSVAGIKKVFALNRTRTKISLPNAKIKTFDLLGKAKPAGKVLILNITVSFEKAPKGDYEVYLNIPEKEAKNPESKYFVGSMTFFGADHKHGTPDGHGHMQKEDRLKKLFRFEVNNAAEFSQALKKANFDITVIKFGGNSTNDFRIENISLTAR